MPRAPSRARYPQRCKVCGYSWLSFTWRGPEQCPFPCCGNRNWRKGPVYLTKHRKAQGWTRARVERGADTPEAELLRDTPIYVEPISVEPLGVDPWVGNLRTAADKFLGKAQEPLGVVAEGPQEALGDPQGEGGGVGVAGERSEGSGGTGGGLG